MCYHCCRTARQELPKSKRGIKKKRDAAALLPCLYSKPTTFPCCCQAFSNMPSRGIAMLSGSSPLLAAHMEKKRPGLARWQQLCQQISNGLGRGQMGCCQADAVSSSSSWTLSRHVSFLFVQRLQTAFYDGGGSVEGEVTWKYLGAAVLRRGQLRGRCAVAVCTTSAFLCVSPTPNSMN